ncbi:MAG: HAMP domain-containing protein [Candidatus Omnitrophota bacterium]
MIRWGRRRRYLINAGLQWRYLKIILVAIILPTILFSGCIYYLIFSMMAEQLALPESIAYNLAPVLNKINLIILFGLPVICIVVLSWGLLISHRIAGPLYRLEQDLDKIAGGDFSLRIRIRKKDELGSLVARINLLLDKITERSQ